MARTLALAQARLAAQVRVAVGTFAHHLALVVRNNPGGDIAHLLGRYDVTHALATALATAQAQAEAAVRRAWLEGGSSAPSLYRDALLADIARAYAGAPAQITAAVTAAYASVPPGHFEVGVSVPGTNPATAAAVQRARAVAAAVAGAGATLALRNRLTVGAAGVAGTTVAVLAQAAAMEAAGEDVRLEWWTRHQPPDACTCPWCRALNGHQVAVGQEFPHPAPLGTRRPPRLYLGHLHGPPLHPNCRCRLAVVTGSQASPAVAEPEPEPEPAEAVVASHQLISSAEIRALPEDRYQRLRHFLRSALHELGQILRRLARRG